MEPTTTSHNFITSCWRGKESAWTVFWTMGLSFLLFVRVILFMFSMIVFRLTGWAVFSAVILPIQTWWTVSMWRCAPNTKCQTWKVLIRAYAFVICVMVFIEYYIGTYIAFLDLF